MAGPGVDMEPFAAALERERPSLIVDALAAGLAGARPRSSSARLALEAERFVGLWSGAVASFSSRAAVDGVALRRARNACFAAASAADVAAVFAVWRRAVERLRARDEELGDAAARALDELEREAALAAPRWEQERIDIVAVGASSGGVPALAMLLSALDSALPATVLLVLHVSPTAPDIATEVLARDARLPIVPAAHGAPLELGVAYVAPPGRHLVVRSERMWLDDGPPVQFVKPSIDVLLRSAAAAYGPRLASVILTGTGEDGADGTRAVRLHGGATLVEAPGSADFRGMPEAALATGAVDRAAPLAELGTRVALLTARGREALAAGGE